MSRIKGWRTVGAYGASTELRLLPIWRKNKMGSGEYITIEEVMFVIKQKNIAGALEALREAQDKLSITVADNATIKDILLITGWEPDFNIDGDIEFINLMIDEVYDSSGDLLFNILAPYVEPKCYIQAHTSTEGGCVFQWVFNGFTCTRKYGSYDFHKYGDIVESLLKRDDVLTFIGIHTALDNLISKRIGSEDHVLNPVVNTNMLMKALDRKPIWSRKELINELGLPLPEDMNWE